jgi:hypothetical protein
LDIDLEVGRERRLEPGEEEALLAAADSEMKVQTTTLRYLNTRIERLKQGVLRAAAKRST